MAARRTSYVKDFQRAVKLGRGTGSHEDYNPFLTVNDVPSQALRTRVPIIRLNRILHVFSHSEFTALLLLEWNDEIVEICEQVGLEPEDTIPICVYNNIRHPSVHGLETVMTTDFLATFCRNYNSWKVAYQVKATRAEAEQPRTAEKLLVEKAYWKSKGVSWQLLVASEFNQILIGHLCELYHLRNLNLTEHSMQVAQDFWDELTPQLDPLGKIAELHVLNERIGRWTLDGYQIAKLLLAKKRLGADMDKIPIDKMRICDITERRWT